MTKSTNKMNLSNLFSAFLFFYIERRTMLSVGGQYDDNIYGIDFTMSTFPLFISKFHSTFRCWWLSLSMSFFHFLLLSLSLSLFPLFSPAINTSPIHVVFCHPFIFFPTRLTLNTVLTNPLDVLPFLEMLEPFQLFLVYSSSNEYDT